jgi:NADH dehydrogenase
MDKIKIVIIGGGFGGIYTAKNLSKLFGENAEITLINKSNYFVFTPLLHEVATGSLTPESVSESIREIFRGSQVIFIEDTVNEIDRANKIVRIRNKSLNYDYLVISSGAETNYFGISGAQENSFGLKNLNDAIKLRNHITSTLDKAHTQKNKDLLSFAIIGAGATGVELATELIEYTDNILNLYYKGSIFRKEDIKISIITNMPDIMNQFPAKMRAIAFSQLKKKGIEVILNTIVTKVESNLITFGDSKTLKANTIIWVAGVKPSLSEIKGIEIGPNNRLEINEYLQLIKNPEIFALGDSAGTYPMLAQIAVQQAKIVANNIYALTNKKELKKFTTETKGLLISLGQWSATGQFGKITLSGPIMWWIWRTIYLFNFNSWKKRFEIAVEWTINLFYPRDITYLK